MELKSNNILVTGSAGFIGSHFVNLLLKQNLKCKVVSYDKLTYAGGLDNLKDVLDNKRHFFIKGDICDQSLVFDTLNNFDIDTIVHFAAESHVDNSIISPETFIKTNIVGTFSILNAAKEYWQTQKYIKNRLHHVSTDEVYGSLKVSDPAFDEYSPYAPNSPYAASKASSDLLVRSYYRTYKLPVTISHCSNNYGPNQHYEKLIPAVIQCCKENRLIPVYGDGSNIRDWLYVEDHVQALLKILESGKCGETYNIGGDNELSNIDLINQICSVLDEQYPDNSSYKKLISFVQDRKGHDWRYAINADKIKNMLKWQPMTSFKKGLTDTIKFYWNKL